MFFVKHLFFKLRNWKITETFIHAFFLFIFTEKAIDSYAIIVIKVIDVEWRPAIVIGEFFLQTF